IAGTARWPARSHAPRSGRPRAQASDCYHRFDDAPGATAFRANRWLAPAAHRGWRRGTGPGRQPLTQAIHGDAEAYEGHEGRQAGPAHGGLAWRNAPRAAPRALGIP